MPIEPLLAMPGQMRAGTTIKLRRILNSFPTSEGWTYRITLAGPEILAKDGTVVDGAFEVTLTANETAKLTKGNYRWTEAVSLAGEKHEAATGNIDVLPDLEAAGPGATQTHEEKTLAVIEAKLEDRLSGDLESYSIAGRSINKIPISELRSLRGKYAQAVWRQKNPGKLGPTHHIAFGGN